MIHTCHAHDCGKRVPPSMLFCRPHWFSLPKPIRDAIWREYRPGQENDKKPSLRYLAVQRWAVGTCAFKPHDEQAAHVAAPYLVEAELYRKQAVDAGLGDPLLGLTDRPPITDTDVAAINKMNKLGA
jgi:hypothetical protein